MRKSFLVTGLAMVVVATAFTIAFAAGSRVTRPMTIHVIEHANTDKYTDTGKPGDSPGDLLTWHNPIFNSTNKRQVGRDQGDCIRIAKTGSWECRWLTYLNGQGSLMVEGAFYDARNSTLAITGGTGMFQNARGTMFLHARNNKGTAYDFTFSVIP